MRPSEAGSPARQASCRTSPEGRVPLKVVVTGATGTIGRAVVDELRIRGDDVVALSRDPDRARSMLGVEAFEWRSPKDAPPPAEAFAGAEGVIHLLGEAVAQRWSDDAKREIRDSR